MSSTNDMNREEWFSTGKRLLEGVFRHIHSIDDPILLPRTEKKITYPRASSKPRDYQAQRFEGLARTFLLGSVLVKEEPDLVLNGINVREYYMSYILHVADRRHTLCVGCYPDLLASETPVSVFQQTVECGLLVIGLWVSRDVIWDRYTVQQKNIIASFLSDYGHGNTVHQNWRLFNMLVLAFLHMNGYEIDREYMRLLAQEISMQYTGDGWYRDGNGYDYYSCWAHQVFLPLWNLWYGYANEPELAEIFEHNANELMEVYSSFFGRDGAIPMWGRSTVYRAAAAAPLSANFFLRNPAADPCQARVLCSAVLRKFLSEPGTITEYGTLSLGWYGPFEPIIQPYSCAESPYWMMMVFLGLALPENHPFWQAGEGKDRWRISRVYEQILNKPGLAVSDHPDSGAVILRTGKVSFPKDKRNESRNYCRLEFRSDAPWENTLKDGSETGNYVLSRGFPKKTDYINAIDWDGYSGGVLYRTAWFAAEENKDWQWTNAIRLADIAVPYGILRIDRLALLDQTYTLELTSAGFPYQVTETKQLENNGWKAMILCGTDRNGERHTMAMSICGPWNTIKLLKNKNTSVYGGESAAICAYSEKCTGRVKAVLLSQVLTCTGMHEFTEEEIFPVQDCAEKADGSLELHMKQGKHYTVDYRACRGGDGL